MYRTHILGDNLRSRVLMGTTASTYIPVQYTQETTNKKMMAIGDA